MIGIILAGYGGPDSLDSVEPFMSSIARGRKFTPEQINAAKSRYKLIGGGSPLNKITGMQAAALEIELNRNELLYSINIGMLHLPPYINDTVPGIVDMGIDKIAVVTLAPFHSRVSTGAYFKEAEKSLENHPHVNAVYVSGWYKNPKYIEAVANEINAVLSEYSASDRDEVHVVFTVHSLPESFIDDGDPYVDEAESAIKDIVPLIKISNWHFAFQSKGRGDDWLGPDMETVMKQLGDNNVKNILVVPIGFISDHVETLFDIDISLKQTAEEIGIQLKRVPALNDSSLFIEALADEIRKSTSHWLR